MNVKNIPLGDTNSATQSNQQMNNEDVVLSIINHLENACENASSTSLFEKSINKSSSLFDDFSLSNDCALGESLLNSQNFNEALEKVLNLTIVPEFSNRDYFSYDQGDFEGRCIVTKCVLEFISKILGGIKLPAKEVFDFSSDNEGKEENLFHHTRQKLTSHLPYLVLIVAGNVRNPIWSSIKCQELSFHLMRLLLDFYECDRTCDILAITINQVLKPVSSTVKLTHRSLLADLLCMFETPLSREKWEKNPFLCEAFVWLVLQLSSFQMSPSINQAMAVALNFINNFETGNKMNGLQILNHTMKTVSNEELRWYNRADVIYDSLKCQIYSKEALVLDGVLDCIFSILKILEKTHDGMKQHSSILSTLLGNAESENIMNLRRIYISHLAQFVPCCGAMCIGHLGGILRVIEFFLEVEDGPEELARFAALELLLNTIKVTWPRIGVHSERILKFLLKFVININVPSFVKMKVDNVKTMLEQKVITCLNSLCKVNSYVTTCLKALQASHHQGYLKDLMDNLQLADVK